MENKVILLGAVIVLVFYIIEIRSVIKNNKIYTNKIKEIYTKDFDPAKVLTEINTEISISNHARVNYLLLDKFFALIWLGSWKDAKLVISRVNKHKLSEERLYRLHFNTLLLKFFSKETDGIEQIYNTFICNNNYSKYWKETLELQVLSCLYTHYVEKDYKKYIRLYQELIDNNKINILYLGVLYLCAGIANYKLSNIEDAIKSFSRAKIFGEKTFINEEVENMLQSIHNNSCNSEFVEINRIIEDSAKQARLEYMEYLLLISKV